MNGILPTQQYTQQPVEEQALSKEKKVGLFRILFIVGITLVLLFIVLNYFNILTLSEIFPNQLGFLPHRPYEQAKRPASPAGGFNNPTITQTPNYSPNTFQYDSEKAKTILTRYIKETIKPEFLPEKLDIRQGLSIDNRPEEAKDQFGIYITDRQSTISVNLHYKENTNTPNDFIIFIQPSKIEQTTITPTLATTLTTSYFINPYSPIENCEIKGTTSYCEIYKIENDGKRGFGVVIAQDSSRPPSKLTSIVFTCFIPKDSKDYDKLKSCISP